MVATEVTQITNSNELFAYSVLCLGEGKAVIKDYSVNHEFFPSCSALKLIAKSRGRGFESHREQKFNFSNFICFQKLK